MKAPEYWFADVLVLTYVVCSRMMLSSLSPSHRPLHDWKMCREREKASRRSTAKSVKVTTHSPLKTLLIMKMRRHSRSDSSYGRGSAGLGCQIPQSSSRSQLALKLALQCH
jgi:hypothetical protein